MRIPGAPVRIVIAAGLLAAGLVGLVVREGVARAAGQEVRLAMQGYDPRALLTGHYVRFQLRHDLPGGTRCPPVSPAGASVRDGWVSLRREGVRHVPAGAAVSRAEALRLGDVAVRGVLTCESGPVLRLPAIGVESQENNTLRLDVGIDRIHLDQAEAEAMERQLSRFTPDAPVEADAIVSVGQDGKARLKGVVVAGRRTDLDWF